MNFLPPSIFSSSLLLSSHPITKVGLLSFPKNNRLLPKSSSHYFFFPLFHLPAQFQLHPPVYRSPFFINSTFHPLLLVARRLVTSYSYLDFGSFDPSFFFLLSIRSSPLLLHTEEIHPRPLDKISPRLLVYLSLFDPLPF